MIEPSPRRSRRGWLLVAQHRGRAPLVEGERGAGDRNTSTRAVFDRNVSAGRRLAYVNVYRDSGVATFSAIFNERDSGASSANTSLTGSQLVDFFAS